LPIWIDETSGLTVSEIRARLQAQLNERPIALCAIDFVQLIRPERGRRYQNENEMFTQIANDLQEMCKVLGTPLLLLSQLNRESEKGKGDRPKLSQARGSGSLEQISNLGALLFREWLARKDRDDMRDRMELIVDKNRSGPSGTIKMRFIPYLMKFEEREGGDE
jgi:replicative DNA helicase